MPERAAIVMQRGQPTPARQHELCRRYCGDQLYTAASLVPVSAPHEAVQLVVDGHIDVVVVAFETRSTAALVADVARAGGRVEAVHPHPRVLQPPKQRLDQAVVALIVGWFRKGKPVREIADLTEAQSGEIRWVLRQNGIEPPPK